MTPEFCFVINQFYLGILVQDAVGFTSNRYLEVPYPLLSWQRRYKWQQA
ncbi:hypothetical protein [Nostoc sp.]